MDDDDEMVGSILSRRGALRLFGLAGAGLVGGTVEAALPYRQKGTRDTPNARDSSYQNGGSQLQLDLKGTPKTGYTSTFDVGLNI